MKTILLSIKTFFVKNIATLFFALVAFFSPIQPLLIGAIMLCFIDFFTGIIAAYINAKKENVSKWLDSKKMQKKFFDILFYLIGIMLSFYMEQMFKELYNFPLCKLVSFIILSTEFWSNMENISVITGMPLNKEAFMKVVDKFRNNNQNTPPPNP